MGKCWFEKAWRGIILGDIMSREQIYRVLSALSHILFTLMLSVLVAFAVALPVGLLADLCFNVKDSIVMWIAAPLFVLVFCASFYFCWRFLHRFKGAIVEGKDRFGSLMLWGTIAIIVMTLSVYVQWEFESNLWAVPFFAAPILALLLAMIWPFKRHGSGMAVHTLTFGGMFWVLLICGFIMGAIGKPVDYQGDNAMEIPHLTQSQIKHIFPDNAKHIVISGSTNAYHWECEASEEDFQKFAVQWDFKEITESTFQHEAPYYEHNKRASNGGGFTLQYFPNSHKLTGFFSTH